MPQISSTSLSASTTTSERGGPSPDDVGAPLAALARLLSMSDEASAARATSLTALAAGWLAAWNESEAAFQDLAAAERAAASSYPDFPVSCTGRDTATGITFRLSREKMNHMMRLDFLSTADVWARRLEVHDQWVAECERSTPALMCRRCARLLTAVPFVRSTWRIGSSR